MVHADHEKRDAAVVTLHRAGWSHADIVSALKSARSMTKELGDAFVEGVIVRATKKAEERDRYKSERLALATMAWQDMPAHILEISARSSNVLKAQRVETLGDFFKWFSRPKAEILATPNLGRTSYQELADLHARLQDNAEAYVAEWREVPSWVLTTP